MFDNAQCCIIIITSYWKYCKILQYHIHVATLQHIAMSINCNQTLHVFHNTGRFQNSTSCRVIWSNNKLHLRVFSWRGCPSPHALPRTRLQLETYGHAAKSPNANQLANSDSFLIANFLPTTYLLTGVGRFGQHQKNANYDPYFKQRTFVDRRNDFLRKNAPGTFSKNPQDTFSLRSKRGGTFCL